MPYNIWCLSCNKHIGMGVRYNAEKTKIGMYYTTPVYQFRMNCHLCSAKISIKTDPGNMDYVIVEGARRVEQRWDPTQNGQIVPDDKSVGRKLADDAMFKLEHERKDKDKQTDSAPRLGQLSQLQDRVKDDWLANRMLRDQFRARKKERKAQLEKDKLITGKCGLELELVAEEDEDVRMARLLNVQAKTDADVRRQEDRGDITGGNIFAAAAGKSSVSKESKDSSKSDKKLHALKTIGKATKSKQSELLNKKGFGLIINKVKEKNTDILDSIAHTPSSKASSSSSVVSTPSSSSTAETPTPTPVPTSPTNNSLSMLFSQYDNSDDSE